MKILIVAATLLFLTGCGNDIYKLQLEKYHSTLGSKCIYYLNKDTSISQKDKDMYFSIYKETSKIIAYGESK